MPNEFGNLPFCAAASIDKRNGAGYTEPMKTRWIAVLLALLLLTACTDVYEWTGKTTYGVHPYYAVQGDRYAYFEGQGGGNVERKSEGTVSFDAERGVATFTPDGSTTSTTLYYAEGLLYGGDLTFALVQGNIPDGDAPFDAVLFFAPQNASGEAAYTCTLTFCADGTYAQKTLGGEGFSSMDASETGVYTRDGILLRLTGTDKDGAATSHLYAVRDRQLYAKVFEKQG